MSSGGFIVLWRKLFDSWFWLLGGDDFKIAVGCVLKANWEDRSWFDGRKTIVIPRGSFVTSGQKWADFCGVTRKKQRGSMAKLERAKFVKLGTHQGQPYTLVTVLNYDDYQSIREDEGPHSGQVGAKLGPSWGQVGATREQTNHRTIEPPIVAMSEADPKPKPKKTKKPPTDLAARAAAYLRDRILEQAPNCQASRLTDSQLANWGRALDGLAATSPEHGWTAIRKSIDWLHDTENTFVVQSPAALAKKWDAIQANRKKAGLAPGGKHKTDDPYELAAQQRLAGVQ